MNPAPPSVESDVGAAGQRLAALDGVRALAILIVLVHEFLHFEPQRGVIATPLGLIARHGATGVTLFFVLSGFLITRTLFTLRTAPRRYRTFFGRRALRILPIYYLVVIVALWWMPEHLSLRAQWPIWLFALNWTEPFTPGGPGPLPHFWSLAVEEQFYLAWPLMVFHCDRRRLLWICAGVALAAVLSRVLLVHWDFPALAIYTFSFSRMDALALGSALAACLDTPQARARWRVRVQAIHGGLWSVVAALLAVQGLATLALHAWMPAYGAVPYHTFVALVWSALIMAVVIHADEPMQPWQRLLASSPMRLIGKHSYAMYALHVPIAMMISGALLHWLSGTAPVGWPVALEYLVILSAIVFVAAWLCYLAVEWPLLRVRDRWFAMPVRKQT